MAPVRLHMSSGEIAYWTKVIEKEGGGDLIGAGAEDLSREGEEDLSGAEGFLGIRERMLLDTLPYVEQQLQEIKILIEQLKIQYPIDLTDIPNCSQQSLSGVDVIKATAQTLLLRGSSLELRRKLTLLNLGILDTILRESSDNRLILMGYANTMMSIRHNYSYPFVDPKFIGKYGEYYKLTAWVQFPLFLLAVALKNGMSIEDLINFFIERCKDTYDPQVLCDLDPDIFSRFLDPKLDLNSALAILLARTSLILKAIRSNFPTTLQEIIPEIGKMEQTWFNHMPNIDRQEEIIILLMNDLFPEISADAIFKTA